MITVQKMNLWEVTCYSTVHKVVVCPLKNRAAEMAEIAQWAAVEFADGNDLANPWKIKFLGQVSVEFLQKEAP